MDDGNYCGHFTLINGRDLMRIVLLGPPGSGKGTQSKLLVARYNVPKISTGEILRENISKNTGLGVLANSFMEIGKLVPDDVMLGMVEDILNQDNVASGFIFDGFPRTIPQAEGFDLLLAKRKLSIDYVINFEVLEDEVVSRLSSRWSCPQCGTIYNSITTLPLVSGICDNCGAEILQREDDKEETVRIRLAVYFEQTEPLVDFYLKKGLLKRISGDGGPENIFDRIIGEISKDRF